MTACKYGDPTCPCQDGDECHYEGERPFNVPPEYVRLALSAATKRAEDAERLAATAERLVNVWEAAAKSAGDSRDTAQSALQEALAREAGLLTALRRIADYSSGSTTQPRHIARRALSTPTPSDTAALIEAGRAAVAETRAEDAAADACPTDVSWDEASSRMTEAHEARRKACAAIIEADTTSAAREAGEK